MKTSANRPECELCRNDGGRQVWRNEHWRVVRVDDASFPAFYRVICNSHVGEFSDLPSAERASCMELVAAVERTLRQRLSPTKVNLASLGNVVPHLHWHVIARFHWDSHFPNPIWGAAQRSLEAPAAQRLACSLDELDAAMAASLPHP